ncbi:hypothetical protein Tco_0910220 [Tanacetum coccineum]|uniref:Retrotransposon gag domain-containing protein n=1 Tax=Tanacetum coccineum TaxID=301880 RepID=A0ABQ5CSD9_9ASTR
MIFLPLLQDILIRASRLKKVMADKGKKSSMETFVPNDKADYYSGITNNDKLIVVVFQISLLGGARRWFDRTKESITCWVDLTARFFGKYYPPSRIEGNNTSMIKWDPANLRFEEWLATKFVNYKRMDIFTKGALWDYWKMGGDEIEVSDDESSDLEEYWSDKEETAEIFKIEIDEKMEEPLDLLPRDEWEYKNETHEEGHELCGIETREVPVYQIKRYKMIKYSFNDEEEYVAVKEDEYDDLTITSQEACRAYREIFRMTDEGCMVTRTE